MFRANAAKQFNTLRLEPTLISSVVWSFRLIPKNIITARRVSSSVSQVNGSSMSLVHSAPCWKRFVYMLIYWSDKACVHSQTLNHTLCELWWISTSASHGTVSYMFIRAATVNTFVINMCCSFERNRTETSNCKATDFWPLGVSKTNSVDIQSHYEHRQKYLDAWPTWTLYSYTHTLIILF